MQGCTRGMVGGVLAVVCATWCGPALAWTAEVSWPTYYRTGPDKHAVVLVELDRGTRVDVLVCDNGWCKVQSDRSVGYVEQWALVTPSVIPPKPAEPATAEGCFDSHETGFGKGETYRYCPRP